MVEAIALLQWPAHQLHILSLGCLENRYTLPRTAGVGQLGLKVADLFMNGQSHGAMGIAKLLTGHEHERKAIFRVTHTLKKSYRLDDAGKIRDLKGLGHSKAREEFPRLENVFFKNRAEPFDPMYKPEWSDS